LGISGAGVVRDSRGAEQRGRAEGQSRGAEH
jgi:hypothetical protein